MGEIPPPLPTSIAEWSQQAHDFSCSSRDPLGFLLIKAVDCARNAIERDPSRQTLEYAIRSLESVGEQTYDYDEQSRLCPLRHMIYGLSVCISQLSQTILNSIPTADANNEMAELPPSMDPPFPMDESIEDTSMNSLDVSESIDRNPEENEQEVTRTTDVLRIKEEVNEESADNEAVENPPPPMPPMDGSAQNGTQETSGLPEEQGDEGRAMPLNVKQEPLNVKQEPSLNVKREPVDGTSMEEDQEPSYDVGDRSHWKTPIEFTKARERMERIKSLRESYGEAKRTPLMICPVRSCLKMCNTPDKLISHHYSVHKRSMWEFPSWISCDLCPEIFHSNYKKVKSHQCAPMSFHLNYYDLPAEETREGENDKDNVPSENEEGRSSRSNKKLINYKEPRVNEISNSIRKRKLDEGNEKSAKRARGLGTTRKVDFYSEQFSNLGLKLKRLERLECPVCKKSVINCFNLCHHLQNVHQTQPIGVNLAFKCCCEKIVRNLTSLKDHGREGEGHEFEVYELAVHSLEAVEATPVIACGRCKEDISDVTHLFDHLEQSHGMVIIEMSGFALCECGQPFIEYKPLLHHLNTTNCSLKDVQLYTKKTGNISNGQVI